MHLNHQILLIAVKQWLVRDGWKINLTNQFSFKRDKRWTRHETVYRAVTCTEGLITDGKLSAHDDSSFKMYISHGIKLDVHILTVKLTPRLLLLKIIDHLFIRIIYLIVGLALHKKKLEFWLKKILSGFLKISVRRNTNFLSNSFYQSPLTYHPMTLGIQFRGQRIILWSGSTVYPQSTMCNTSGRKLEWINDFFLCSF